MIIHYIKIAVRSLYKNPLFTCINLAGLVVGLVSSMLIGLWVHDELSWDGFHEHRDRLYRVYLNRESDEGIDTQMAICLPLWEEFKTNEPGIEHVAPTNWGWDVLLSTDERRFQKFAYFVGDEFLDMFTFPVVEGDRSHPLADPTGIVLTRSTARAYFGDEDPIGKTIRLSDQVDLSVRALVDDPPGNSSFQFDCLIPFTTYVNADAWVRRCLTNWDNNSFNLYVEFRTGADPVNIEQRVRDVIKQHNPLSNFEVTFLPMERWRLYSEFKNGKSVDGNILYVRIFSLVGIFILVMACINFTNLATARSERRAREVGIRKSIGSRRFGLIAQFLGETLALALIAFVLAVALVQAVLPWYNTLIGRQIQIHYGDPLVWMISGAIVFITGITAGCYPAFFLSSFKPVTVLKGTIREGNRGSFPRKILVTGQFFFSISLIIATIIIYQQSNFLASRPVGYDKHNLVMIGATGEITKNYTSIKRELLDQGLASSVTISSSPMTNIYSFNEFSWPGKRDDQRRFLANVAVGKDYTATTGIRLVAGRDFSEGFNDSLSVMLNEAAVAYMGLREPVGTVLKQEENAYRVVGVVADVVMTSPQEPAEPTVYLYSETWTNSVLARLPDNRRSTEVLAGMEKVFARYNPAFPFSYVFADQEYARKFTYIRLIGMLSNLFAVLAIVIACLGLFGLAAYTVERRTKEIGIRKVLGATLYQIVKLLSGEFALLVAIAFLIAAPLTLWKAVTILQSFPYHVVPAWWVLPLTALFAFVLTMAAVSTQAIQAARNNPVDSLRSE